MRIVPFPFGDERNAKRQSDGEGLATKNKTFYLFDIVRKKKSHRVYLLFFIKWPDNDANGFLCLGRRGKGKR